MKPNTIEIQMKNGMVLFGQNQELEVQKFQPSFPLQSVAWYNERQNAAMLSCCLCAAMK